jgi:protein involved in polysaccharide export with SLBB domain
MLLGLAALFVLESFHRSDRFPWVKALGATVLGIGLLTACSTAQTPRCDGMSQSGTGSSSYSLGSGDQLQVVVFRQPDLSGEFSLDREGYLALPLVGEIAAGGLTTRRLEDEIESRLKAGGFLVSPQVGVQLVSYRAFYILGEVGTPGSYEYRTGITVITAVALAGGYTARADRSSATIGRGDCRFATQADTFVDPGDIITIAERFF